MTRGAVLRRPDGEMVEMHAGRPGTVVAGGTVIHDAGMVEYSRRKGATGYMADPAILVGDQMRRVDLGLLADGIGAVVA